MLNQRVLVVMSSPQRGQLVRLLEENGMDVFLAGSVQDARRRLGGSISYRLVCAESHLPDGSWKDLLQFILDCDKQCEMIVCSRCGDERLWAEVIQCGAFDLIPEPYEDREIIRIVRSAMDSNYMRRFAHFAEARAS